MSNAAVANLYDPKRTLIDELNDAVAAGGDKERSRIVERLADLFAAGSRGYSSAQIALFDDVLQKLAAEIEVKARAKLAQRFAFVSNARGWSVRSPSTMPLPSPSRC